MNKKKFKKENKKRKPKKDQKLYKKGKKLKKLGPMVAPVHNLDPTILLEGSAKLRWGRGQGSGDFLFHSLCGPVERKKPMTWAARVQ
jgi:hypothetical protein